MPTPGQELADAGLAHPANPRQLGLRGAGLQHHVSQNVPTVGHGTSIADTAIPATLLGVTGVAYYNNDQDPATATTLFALDTTLDQITIQSPANAGSLAATGKLGVDAQGDAGFDIHYDADAPTSTNSRGIAALNVGGTYRLYDIELLTGRATPIGDFPQGQQIVDLTTGFRRDEIEGILLGEGASSY